MTGEQIALVLIGLIMPFVVQAGKVLDPTYRDEKVRWRVLAVSMIIAFLASALAGSVSLSDPVTILAKGGALFAFAHLVYTEILKRRGIMGAGTPQ